MIIDDYICLGLELDKHVPGTVDAYYGSPEILESVRVRPKVNARVLAETARELLGALDSGQKIDGLNLENDSQRRRWLKAQVIGLWTTARRLSGEDLDYLAEVELCYGVRPRRVSRQEIEDAKSLLGRVFPGVGDLRDRISSYRESFKIAPEKLEAILNDLAELLRDRTNLLFGLPVGEHLEFEIVNSQPWSGFNYYLGGLRSKVAINSDLPVLSTSLAHLVAHEAYPGHHTEHTRKEVELVDRRGQIEESIFLVGTPQCLMAEGLADFGLEMLLGDEQFSVVSGVMVKRGINYPDQELELTRSAFETLGKVRANAAWDLHQRHLSPEKVVEMMENDALLSKLRAEKSVQFLTDPTWRAYITCYVEGYQLVRNFVGSPSIHTETHRSERFRRLISEQLIPDDLIA